MTTGEILLTISVVIGFSVVLSLLSLRNKNSAWEGELIKKKKYEDTETLQTTYKLIFKTESGKKIKMNVNSQVYNQFEIGDKAEKIKGEYLPKQIKV